MTTYSTCIFCNRNDSKPSREDVLPKWIAKEFPNARFVVRDVVSNQEYGAVNQLGVISKAPCERCNNDWMSQLETKAQPILTPMMHGLNTELTPDDQLTVARWLVKTSIMFDLRKRNRTPYFTKDECHALMQSLIVPPDTLMFLAIYFGKLHAGVQELGTTVDRERLPETYIDWVDVQTYSATFTINQLALQTFSLRRPEQMRNDAISVECEWDWSTAEVQIWPTRDAVVAWPPPAYLDDALLSDFATRFGKPVNYTVWSAP